MLKLDKKDLQILYELDRNARQPLSRIAKRVNLSRESILYRSKKYLQEGIIRDYLTIIDLALLGFVSYKIYVRLQNISEAEEKAMVADLCSNPFVAWVASCDGKYSLIFALKARTLLQLNKLLKEISQKYWRFFGEREITSIIFGQHFYRDYLVEKKGTTERKILWGSQKEEVKLDPINLDILDALSKDARYRAVEIAQQLKISADAVIYRIKQLEKSGLIQNYMLWPNVTKLKMIYYKMLIRMHNLTEDKEQQLVEFCKQNLNIVYIVNCLGQWQFEIDLEIESDEKYRQLMREFLQQFSDIISDYTTLNIYEEHKFKFFEKGMISAPSSSP